MLIDSIKKIYRVVGKKYSERQILLLRGMDF